MQIPLFPLRLVVFPEEKLNLHIFEPRYLNMIQDCMESGQSFGIPSFIENKVMPVGAEMRVVELVKTYENGEFDIKTQSVGLFEIEAITKYDNQVKCDVGDIRPYFIDMDQEEQEVIDLIHKVNILFKSLSVKQIEYSGILKPISFALGHLLGLSLKQEYELLCLKKESARIKYLSQYVEGITPEEKVKEVVMRKINLNGHFKNVIPPM